MSVHMMVEELLKESDSPVVLYKPQDIIVSCSAQSTRCTLYSDGANPPNSDTCKLQSIRF